MAIPQKLILDLIRDLPEEKIEKVIGFIRSISEEDSVLMIEPDDEQEILNILEDDEWYSSEDVKEMIKDKKDE